MSQTTETVQSINLAAIDHGVDETEVDQSYQYEPEAIATIDLSLAKEFITALTGSPNTPVTFQVFRDDQNVQSQAKHFYKSLTDATPELTRFNREGQGVFVTISETDGKGRHKKNIIAPRALFLDFDTKEGQFIDEDKLKLLPNPSAKIISGGGCHLYWFLKSDEPLEALEPALGQLIQYMSTDKACKDISRVMRIPGFLHQKAEKGQTPNPFLVTIDYCNPESRYSIADVVSGIPAKVAAPAKELPSKPPTTHSLPYGDNKDFDRMLAAAAAKIANLTEGGRNNTLNTEAYTMAGLSGNDPVKLEAIRVTLTAAALQCGLEQSDIDATLGSAISSGLTKPIAPNGSGCDEPIKLPAIDAAKLLRDEVLTNIEFDTYASQWWEYDGKGKWNPVADARIFKLAQDFLDGKVQIGSSRYLDDCIRFAKSHVQVDGWSEADNSRYIPFTNGVLDLKANHFQEHSSGYRLTWQLPRAHSLKLGSWEHIDRFLDTLSNNDPGLKELAIAFCNAVLKGRSDLHKSLYLFGSGANGKGAFITLLEMLIGKENIHSTSMGELNTNRFESANIRGKRLVMMPDEDKYGGGLNVFKAATGGNPVKYERKGENASTFLFQGMIVIAANKPTFLGNSDGGMGRRIVSFPCKSVIAPKDRRDMSPMFDADLTAFTAYLLSLDDNWVADTIHNAGTIAAVKELATELAIRGDSVAAFYHAKLELNPGVECSCGGLYEAYREYCQASGVSAKGLNNFTPDLMEYCNTRQGGEVAKKRTKSGMVMTGINHLVKSPE